MTFLAPGFLLAALAATAALVAAHLIAWRQPPDLVLPTARFVPDEAVRQSARAVRLTDAALLALRAAMLILAGAALARPVVPPARSGSAMVIAADLSGSAADLREVRDSVAALRRDGVTAVVLAFDTTARVAGDDLEAPAGPRPSGALSPALVALARESSRLRARYERVELAIVSPLLQREFDAATLPLRALLRDSIRLVRVRPAEPARERGEVIVRAPGDDAVAAGIRLGVSAGLVSREGAVRVVRDGLTSADSAWAAGGPNVLVWWPAAPADERGAAASADVRGVATAEATLLGHLRPTGTPAGVPVARWLDGSPAAGSKAAGQGCIRHVAFDVPRSGDLSLTPAFQRVAGGLLRPCDPQGGAVASDSVRAQLSAPLMAGARTVSPSAWVREPNRLGAVLLVLALAAAALETIVRRRPARARTAPLPARERA